MSPGEGAGPKLRCPRCGVLVPLAPGHYLTCPYCGRTIDVRPVVPEPDETHQRASLRGFVFGWAATVVAGRP